MSNAHRQPPRGPGSGRMAAMNPRPKLDKQTAMRLLRVVFKPNIVPFIFVVICIAISAFANVQGSLFL